ncbi:MAG: hypothetical protein HYU58_18030 [Proteobacteria bacterium]|nr:hypothetical protein [Pseudomonadota bacterium]
MKYGRRNGGLIGSLFMIPTLAGLLAYEQREKAVRWNEWTDLRDLIGSVILCYVTLAIVLKIFYYLIGGFRRPPKLRHAFVDAGVIVAPLALVVSSYFQRNFADISDGIVIGGTFLAMGVVVMIYVFRNNAA